MWHGELCPLQTMFVASDLKHCMFLFHFLPSVSISILPLLMFAFAFVDFLGTSGQNITPKYYAFLLSK